MRQITTFFTLLYLGLFSNFAMPQDGVEVWLNSLRQDALEAGVSAKTVNATIHHIDLLPNVIKLDLAQPEFISPFFGYYQNHVNTQKVVRGRELLAQHKDLLNKIEAQYGVPKSLLVAFWGMETNYGRYQGNIDTLSALATLAYDGRRADFFRNQLIDAMRMIDAGNAEIGQLQGSWAGAFGNMQFMPTTFLTYAVDGSGDDRIDVVNSLADSFASAANYLSQVGWNNGEPVMIEVQLPKDFKWNYAQLSFRRTVDEWAKLGVMAVEAGTHSEGTKMTYQPEDKLAVKYNKKRKSNIRLANSVSATKVTSSTPSDVMTAALPKVNGQAAIVLPQGWQGPAFMVFDNFDAVMDWNRSVHYALTVVQLAKQLNGESGSLNRGRVSKEALSFEQMLELQEMLNAGGFNAGEPDGFPGAKTQAAIRRYQLSQNLPADGYADPSLYEDIKRYRTSELKTSQSD